MAFDGIRDLVGFLDRVRSDAREILLAIPGATRLWVAKPGHDGDETVDGHVSDRLIENGDGVQKRVRNSVHQDQLPDSDLFILLVTLHASFFSNRYKLISIPAVAPQIGRSPFAIS